jgi:hypothetical protein
MDGSLTKQALLVTFGTIAATWLAPALYATEPAGGSADEQTMKQELKELEDPTIFVRRAWLETEWNKYTDGSSHVEETLGGFWAWPISTNQDWGVRLKVPYEWHTAAEGSGQSDEQGLGDIKIAAGTAFRLSESWRVAGGLELRMPTAEQDLGNNVWQLQEIGAVAWDTTRWLTLSPSAEYNQSVAQEHDGSPQHYLEVFFPATFLLPHQWSVTPRYEIKVNFENGDYLTHSAKLLVAKQLDNPPLAIALSIKRSFDGGEKEFQANFIITYFFR